MMDTTITDTTPAAPARQRGAAGDPGNAVSGIVFLALRHFVIAHYRPGTLHTLCQGLEPEVRVALTDPNPRAEYPEAVWLSCLESVHEKLVDKSPGKLHALIFDATLSAMRYGFREVMDIGGARHALERVPELWMLLFGPAATVSVQFEYGSACIAIENCRACTHPLYRQAVLAMLRALLYAATGVEHNLSIKHESPGELELRVGGLN